METYIDGNVLSRMIAEEKTKTRREPVVLAYPVLTLSNAVSWYKSLFASIQEVYRNLGKSLAYEVTAYNECTLKPYAC